VFFPRQDVASIASAVSAFEAHAAGFDPAHCREHAERFSRERFLAEFSAYVEQCRAGAPARAQAIAPRIGAPAPAGHAGPVEIKTAVRSRLR
jgi:hypothetical protein